MIDLNSLDLRTLQKESTKALMTMDGSNNGIYKFNKAARHNSQQWYKEVIQYYIELYDGLPSETGPAKDIVLFSEKLDV